MVGVGGRRPRLIFPAGEPVAMDGVEALCAIADVDRADLLEHFASRSYRGFEYRALGDARHGLERGTVVAGDAVVRGYPSIPRVLVLDPGVEAFFDGPLVLEEKLNGYNVRVARVDGTVRAFTRSGYVCPYTTERLRELYDLAPFFAAHPGTMLCGEFVGPETPFTEHDYPEFDSHAFVAFDVRDRETCEPWPVGRRREATAEFGFERPRSFGTVAPDAAPARVREVIADLHDAGREGVVMQSAAGDPQLKYTTSAQHRGDLAMAFAQPFDYGRDFLFPRVVREGFQTVEFDEDEATRRERAHALGEAILLPMADAIERVRRDESIGETHTIRGDPDAIERLLALWTDLGLTLETIADRREDGERVVAVRKVAVSSRDTIEAYLAGSTVDQQ
jgi:putative ATP-dependent DNA ligase